MFLHQSNRLEFLLQQLRAVIHEPLADPLAPEIVVVQNPGMAQWVAQHLAFSAGIAAHFDFPLPARFVWDVLQRLTGTASEEDRYRKPVLRWRIAALLPSLLALPAFGEISAYVQDDDNGSKLYQLAGRIGDVFDQYLVYRPDLLARWEQGEETHWQAQLWRALVARAVPHRARLADRFRRLLADQADIPGRLPQRCHLFGLNSLAPVYLDVVAQLSRHIEVHLYHLSPCRHYWGDLVSARQMAGMRSGKRHPPSPSIDSYYEEGHPLLLSLGKTGQDFFRQLVDYDLQEIDLYCEDAHSSLLTTLQNDLLDLCDRTTSPAKRWPLQPDDRSVQCHCCFSPLREVQVLHDRLLDLFQRFPDLTPGDILVSAPDIQVYADAIAGVFGEPGPARRIPWSLADQTLNREHPLVRCLLDLLDLVSGRFTAPEILALCETPALLTRFGLDPALLPRLHAWVQETGIRWGLDETHRRELDIQTGGGLHSWRFGLDRLLLGYLMGDSRDISCDILPYANLAAGEAAELGGFLDLIDTLAQWRLRLRQPRPIEAWCADLSCLLTDFFAPEEDDQGMRTLREAISALKAECSLAGHEQPLAFAVLREHLKSTLAQPGGGQAFLSGRVTFCNMVPMRSVPFRIVCLLGMNDQDFPRSQHPVAFDLMADEPRLGDRNRRQDDRYLFLEALLSARDVLYLSWVGRNQRDDALTPPSAVICELLDYLEQSCLLEKTGIAAHLTTVHPMQPFSRRCYDGSPATASFNPAWLPAEYEGDSPPFLPAPLESADETWRTVDLRQLIRFWRHPVRSFLERILGLHVREGEAVVAESEPFALDRLQHYQLRRETITDLLAGVHEERIRRDLEASGRLPQGGFGQAEFTVIAETGTNFARHLLPLQAHPLEPVEIDRTLGPFRITGWLTDLYPEGRVTWRAGSLKGADLIELWTHHLVLNLLAPTSMAPLSIHLSYDTTQKNDPVRRTTFGPVTDAAAQLRKLLDLYWQGLTRPLPFFPETSLAWAKAAGTGKEEERARPVWTGGYQRRGEGEESAYSFFFSATTLPLTTDFIALTTLFAPILPHLEVRDRATA